MNFVDDFQTIILIGMEYNVLLLWTRAVLSPKKIDVEGNIQEFNL